MPINQIVEVEKADDESINIIKLVISDLAVSAKSDAEGAPVSYTHLSEIRTPDTLIKSQVLFQLS